jgi:hypothetical protein
MQVRAAMTAGDAAELTLPIQNQKKPAIDMLITELNQKQEEHVFICLV